MKIAFLGTGLMGQPMAKRLLAAGYEVIVYNRTLKRAEPLKQQGATVVAKPKEAVDQAEAVIVMLSDGDAIEGVLFGEKIDFSHKTVIQMSTIAPQESVSFKNRIQALKGEYFECPVLGSIKESEEGSLILMVGGQAEQLKKFKKLLKCFGPKPKLVGEVGQAAAMKLALNQLIAAHVCSFGLSLGFIQKQGVEVGDFMEILERSSLNAPMFRKKLPRLLERNYDNPNFPAKHLLKDVDLFIREAKDQGLSVESLESIYQIIYKTLQKGLGEGDYSVVFETINPKD